MAARRVVVGEARIAVELAGATVARHFDGPRPDAEDGLAVPVLVRPGPHRSTGAEKASNLAARLHRDQCWRLAELSDRYAVDSGLLRSTT